MHSDVVVLGWQSDMHVSSVLAHLEAVQISSICLDQIELWQDTVTFQPERQCLKVGKQALTSCFLIWNRRVYPTEIKYMSRGEKKFARSEFSHSLLGALSVLSNTWFNCPNAIRLASYKVAQLAWAINNERFNIPRSLITSNVDEAKAFISDKRSRYIIKPLSFPMIESHDQVNVVYTSLVDERILKNLGKIKHSPCIIQEFIDRKYDVRVNVIGDDIFGTIQDTRHIKDATIDGRRVSDYRNILHMPIELPDKLKRACFDMCAHFGLRFGAFDFVVDKNNNWFFLEVNPNGQWYWIEEMTGQPLSAAMAREIEKQVNSKKQLASHPGKCTTSA